MAIGIDEIDDYDDFEEVPQLEEPEVEEKQWMEPEPSSDVILEVLRSKGIDPNAVKFEDDYGNIQSRDWNSLTKEEQFNILNTPEYEEPSLYDDEAQLLNGLRSKGLTVQEYENLLRLQGAQLMQQPLTVPQYQVDDIPDDDLYVYDLRSKVDITDELALRALEKAKEDPEIYSKQVEGLRNQYRELEKQAAQERLAEIQQYQADQFNLFAETIYDQIDNLDGVGGLDIQLADEDKEELSEFILGRGADGVSNLGRAINDPETLVKMSWFALHGADALDGIVDYFKNEITKVREESYRRGYDEARNGAPQVFVQRPTRTYNNSDTVKDSINDLD